MERGVGEKREVGKEKEVIDGKIGKKTRIIKEERGTTTPRPGRIEAKAFQFEEKSYGQLEQRKVNRAKPINKGDWQKKWTWVEYTIDKAQRRRRETFNRPKVHEVEQKGEEPLG